jgi:serine/threonine-protein kinase
MFRIANEAQPDIRTLNPQVPDGLAEVINRALNKDMKQRYQTGEKMASDLRTCMIQAPAQHPDVDILL